MDGCIKGVRMNTGVDLEAGGQDPRMFKWLLDLAICRAKCVLRLGSLVD